MQFLPCTLPQHGAAILDILNEAIAHSTALYEYRARTPESMRAWFAEKEAGGFPVIGAELDGVLLGFATYGTFRARAAYKYTVEHSVYVHRDCRGRGIGKALMLELIAAARAQQYHVLVGGIDIANRTSVALHERLGFTYAGTVRQAAYKFGDWLDLGFYQLILDTPAVPIDG
ncbi:MAG TPA: GNAT family N-acetyltransferase [Steroidobacteraceae bacterium]|jgi:L-amino acid N-acyltransferase YncA|nr:GNAT family N-acetyltransferase [Steroidobacteraceae bacterium]